MDDPRPATISDLREFKEELRRELLDLRSSVRALETGQNSLALQFANSQTTQAEKAAVSQKELLEARVKESVRVAKLDTKTALLWTAAGAILLMAAKLIFDMISKK